MKYLKKFNEELRPDTYRSIAKELVGHPTKSREFLRHADDLERKKCISDWKRLGEKYSKYSGPVKLDIPFDTIGHHFQKDLMAIGFDKPINAYPFYAIDTYLFNEEYGDGENALSNHLIYFNIMEGFIPADEESMNTIFDASKLLNDFKGYEFIDNGSIIHTRNFSIDIELDPFNIKIDETKDEEYHCHKIGLCDDAGAKTCLNLLRKCFNGLDYPVDYTGNMSFYDWLEANVIVPLSSEYGVLNSPEDIGDAFFKNYSNKSKFYEEFSTSDRNN